MKTLLRRLVHAVRNFFRRVFFPRRFVRAVIDGDHELRRRIWLKLAVTLYPKSRVAEALARRQETGLVCNDCVFLNFGVGIGKLFCFRFFMKRAPEMPACEYLAPDRNVILAYRSRRLVENKRRHEERKKEKADGSQS